MKKTLPPTTSTSPPMDTWSVRGMISAVSLSVGRQWYVRGCFRDDGVLRRWRWSRQNRTRGTRQKHRHTSLITQSTAGRHHAPEVAAMEVDGAASHEDVPAVDAAALEVEHGLDGVLHRLDVVGHGQ